MKLRIAATFKEPQLRRMHLPLALLLVVFSSADVRAFRVIDVSPFSAEFSHLGISRWNADPHFVDGVERSLDGGLRYSVEGGSYEAFRDRFEWSEPAPTVEEFQATIEESFAVWEAQDPATGLGTDLYFVPDFATSIVMEPIPSSLQGFFRLNRGAEIDLASATFGGSDIGSAYAFGDPNSDSVTLTSGVTDYSAAVFSGVDIRIRRTSVAPEVHTEVPWTLTDFRHVLSHEIGHALGVMHPNSSTGGGFRSAFYDDNYDGTSDATALDTLTNSFAELIDPLDPDNSPALVQVDVCTSGSGDHCASSPGVDTPGVNLMMEALLQRIGLQNDEYAARQFLYPFVSPALLLGDVNFDGQVNGLDVDPFVDIVVNGTNDNAIRLTADMNSDGVINGLDVDPFVAAVVAKRQTVPEPSCGSLLAIAGLVTSLLVRCRYSRF